MPTSEKSHPDARSIVRSTIDYKLPTIVTIAGTKSTVAAIRSLQSASLEVKALQDYLHS
jgi:carbamoyl-phosphate synthase large subunit